MILESNKGDIYCNNCSISWANILFSAILRNYSETIQFNKYDIGSDFSLIVQYIQNNYKTLTLSALAEYFHYSEAHLSVLIKVKCYLGKSCPGHTSTLGLSLVKLKILLKVSWACSIFSDDVPGPTPVSILLFRMHASPVINIG